MDHSNSILSIDFTFLLWAEYRLHCSATNSQKHQISKKQYKIRLRLNLLLQCFRHLVSLLHVIFIFAFSNIFRFVTLEELLRVLAATTLSHRRVLKVQVAVIQNILNRSVVVIFYHTIYHTKLIFSLRYIYVCKKFKRTQNLPFIRQSNISGTKISKLNLTKQLYFAKIASSCYLTKIQMNKFKRNNYLTNFLHEATFWDQPKLISYSNSFVSKTSPLVLTWINYRCKYE